MKTILKQLIMFWKNLFEKKPELKIEYIGETTFKRRNCLTGNVIFTSETSVFRRVLNGVSKEIFVKVNGETYYFDCEIFDATKRLVKLESVERD